jgi:hypothetical protein
MRKRATVVLMFGMALASAAPVWAQASRTDAIWARTAPAGSITLDGNLTEPVWATAESWKVHYRYDNGIPGSGWKDEGGYLPNQPTNDSTNATLRFLVIGNQLYLGATVPDRSVGGSGQFGFADGFLMGLKDHSANLGFPKPIMEYLYSWWYPREAGKSFFQCSQSIDSAVGNPPIFKGRWAPDPVCDSLTGQVVVRTANQIAQWDARTIVNGTTNTDATLDVGYTVEMRFNLDSLGYHMDQVAGDIVEWNISIYDTDQYWKSPLTTDLVLNRTWWACPWGNIAEQDEVRIYAMPSVTTSSGALPAINPDFRIPITGTAAPVIDGNLTDAIWSSAPSLDIRWNDTALRASYSSVGKWRSGEYQPRLSVNAPAPNPLPAVGDGGDATVKYFWKGDFLYLGFDARDLRVQSNTVEDEWDGFTVSITSRSEVDLVDHNLQGKALSFHVGPSGAAVAAKDLPALISAGTAQVALVPKAGTTVDSTGTTNDDTGYTAELKVDLKALGYPPGLGDHTMFLGITLHDQDRYSNPLSLSYATRTWWYREREEQCCPAWTYLDPTFIVGSSVGVGDGLTTAGFEALGNNPNPFHSTTSLDFALARGGDVTLLVFDTSGRLIQRRALGRYQAGRQQVPVTLPNVRSGLYLYRLEAHDPTTGALMANLPGKMMHLR